MKYEKFLAAFVVVSICFQLFAFALAIIFATHGARPSPIVERRTEIRDAVAVNWRSNGN